jgi:hypothetical protein
MRSAIARAPTTTPASPVSTAGARLLERARSTVRTTPGTLWSGVAGTWLLALLFWAAGTNAIVQTRHATQVIGRDSAPSIIAAQTIAATLADMDANAANYLLGNASQNTQADQAFEKDSATVTDALISAAQNITYGDEERVPIKTINENLHVYLEQIGAARTLQQRGSHAEAVTAFRSASTLMASTILPAANALDAANDKYLNAAYAEQRGSSAGALFLVVIAGVALVAALVATQVFLTRRTRRVFNLPLLAAMAIAVVLLLVLYGRLRAGDEDLRSAKQDAFDSVYALWHARAVAYDANGDESRYLLDPSNATAYEQAFMSKVKQLAAVPSGSTYESLAATSLQNTDDLPPGFTGFLATELHNITFDGELEAATETLRTFGSYIALDGQIRALERSGQHQQAIDLCIGYQPGQSNWAFAQFDTALGKTLDINQNAFTATIDKSFGEMAGLDVVTVIAAIAIAALTFAGLWPRISEYR